MSSGSGVGWMRTRLSRRLLSPGAPPSGDALESRRGKTVVAVVVAALVVPLGLAPVAQAAAPEPLGRPHLAKHRSAKVHTVGLGAKQARVHAARAKAADDKRAKRALAEQHAAWPKGGTAQVPLNGSATPVAAGGLPVAVTQVTKGVTSGSAQVTVLNRAATHAAGVRGVLLSVQRRAGQAGGQAKVSIGYSAFAAAYGGDWSGRLQVVTMPACALTTPQKAECREQTPLQTANDASKRTVSATVPLADANPSKRGVTVLAVTGGSGESAKGGGNYSATALSASATWSAGGSSGSFGWSYPMAVPSAPAGPAPSPALSYDSGSIDGRTASTNNQGSQVGEGFDISTDSYIERQYSSCDDDGQSGKYDLCWKYDNSSLVLNGKSTELVRDDTTGTWRLADDDASTVTKSYGAENGDNNGEYWTVTTGDGTKYVFGLNKLAGAGSQRTNSVWTAPVFGDDSGEPGYSQGTTFADRSTIQAWRWNLDYVEDPHGNAMSYWYTAETNYYRKNGASTADTQYTRGGHLDKILYGQQAGTLFTATAPYQVTYGYNERCTATDCSSLNDSTSQNWPDVPYDQMCASGASSADCQAVGPAFFTRKRLTEVETSVWSGTAYTPVDTWALTHKYLDAGDLADSSDQTLVLDTIRHTGQTGTPITLDPVSFTYQMLANRVDAVDDILPLHRPRIDTITSETGAITRVTLSPPECVRGSNMPAAEDNDTKSCFPQYWHINDAQTAGLDWFHKYRVTSVSTADPTGNNQAVIHSYSYSDPAWHYNDSPLTPEDERTWSVWRGYGTVTAYTGASTSNRLQTVTRYMQGMDGDKQKDGTTRSVSVTGLSAPAPGILSVTDSDQYAGFVRQQVTYNGATPVSATANDPWSSQTATQHKSYADIEAFYIRTKKAFSYTYRTVPQNWRISSVATTYDSYGMPVTVDSAGDTGKTGDETCTRTWYARNTALGITSLPSRIRTVGQTCATAETSLSLPTSSATRGDVLADSATVYDNTAATAWSATQTPTDGDVTWTGRASAYPATADANGERYPSSWQTVSTSTFDSLGRLLTVKDVAGNTTSSSYTPTGAGVPTSSLVINAKNQAVSTYFDGVRGLPLRSYDVGSRKTEMTYDGLGRLTGVWLPNRIKSGGDSANTTYTYHVDSATQPYVATSTLGLNNSRNTAYQIYDALLRPLQVQSPTPLGGRLMTDTRYDSRGLAYETFADINDDATAPGGTYVRADYGGAPTQHEVTFDGAGRATSDNLYIYGVHKWGTTTTYTGDSTATTALAGGSASRVITDALGRTTERRDYASTSPADASYGGTAPLPGYTTTGYTYTRDGKQATVTGPDSARWTYSYDLFGRQISAADPDMGTTTTAYTNLDEIVSTTDSAGKKLVYAYDSLGRKTGLWQTDTTDANKLAAWTYDTAAKGQLDSAIRYDGGLTGRAYTQKVTSYDDLYHPVATEIDLDPNDPLVTSGVAQSTYAFASYYNPDGSLQNYREPTVANLGWEIVSYGYTQTGQVTTASGMSGYLLSTSYSALGEPELLTLGTSPISGVKKAYIANVYEEGTGRLKRSSVTDDTHGWMPQDLNYSYDDAGNVTKINDPTTLGGTSQADTQCFTYDGYRRLTSAWTPANADCASKVTGGAAPYSTDYTYNAAGLRLSETQHATGGDTTTLSCYGNSGQPHTLTATTTGASCTGVPASYGYDSTGNTTKRPASGTSQALSWDTEGHAATAAKPAPITGIAGKCVDIKSSNTTAGTPIQIYTCNGTGAQNWQLKPDGTLSALGVCAAAAGTSLRSLVQVKACNASDTSQQWEQRLDGSLYQPASGMCLDVPGSNTTNGTQLQIYTCNGTSAQIWTLTGQTQYLYGADGGLLIRRDGSGETVLYLGGTELHSTKSGGTTTTWPSRTYTAGPGGPAIALRTTQPGTPTLSWLAGDQHGTAGLALDSSTQAVTKRYTTPFGAPRGTAPTWPDDKSFLGKPADPDTGLTHIGAREYDPTTARFLSVDPLLNTADAQSLNGYTYADNNPTTFSDPTGQALACGGSFDEACPSSGKNSYNPPPSSSGSGKTSGTSHGGGTAPTDSSGSTSSTGTTSSNSGTGTCSYPFSSCSLPQPVINNMSSTAGPVIPSQARKEMALAGCSWVPIIGAACDAYDLKRSINEGSTWGILAGVIGFVPFGDALKVPRALERIDEASDLRHALRGIGRGCSFTPSTPVLMEDGKTKPIGKIKTGDRVEAADPATGKHKSPRTVTATHINHDNDLIDLTIETSPRHTEVLHTTSKHPFWDDSLHAWVPAGQLTSGHVLNTATDQHVSVISVRVIPGSADMYNLTVDELHTYYVLAGTTPILVHNSNCAPFELDAASQSGAQADRGGYSYAGRALAKHAGRNGNSNGWPVPSGVQNPAAWNATGQDMLDEILTNPGSTFTPGYGRIGGQWQDTIDVRLPSGLGARFSLTGQFSGFLD